VASAPAKATRPPAIGISPKHARAAGHETDQLVLGGFRIDRRHVAAVTQDRDAVADASDLAHAVGNVDDADAACLDLLDQSEKLLGLAVGQRGRRLVENEHGEVGAERLGDLDHLLLGAREKGDALRRTQRKAEAFQDLRRALVQGRLVEHAEGGLFGAQEQVLLHRELRHQLLEHGADPQRPGMMDGRQVDSLAAELDPSGVGTQRSGNDRDERRLARTILAEKNVHLARPKLEIDIVQRQDTGKPLGDPFEPEERRVPARQGPAILNAAAHRVSRSVDLSSR
jgi:hypothetical protein